MTTTLKTPPRIEILLTDDGMGEDATRADAEAYRDFVDARLTTLYPDADVTVTLLRRGDVTARTVELDETEHQDVGSVMHTLWDEFCADASLWPSTRAEPTVKIKWSHGLTETAATREDAEAKVRVVLTEPVIEWFDDGTPHGYALAWATEEDAENDDGARARAKITVVTP